MWKQIKSSGIRPVTGALMAASLLVGCASMITSQVAAFRRPGWVDNPPYTYAFEHTAAQQNNPERQTCGAWASNQLAAHGFTSVPHTNAHCVVHPDYPTITRLVQVRQPVYPGPY